MKAVILAGGNGTRLHPLSISSPKPMARLLDRPLLEHIIMLLKSSGITEICLSLCYLPERIISYFGDGSDFGVHIENIIEHKALGTAGGVKNCADFIGSDDFIVISGDAACSFDLDGLIAFYRSEMADAAIAVYSSDSPSEYGLVLTSENGTVESFIEKPPVDRIYTDSVNTGIYIFTNRILNCIPENTFFDFASDLFPALLKDGKKVVAYTISGYWCDIGNCCAYLKANIDALKGDLKLKLPEGPRSGVYSLSAIPEDITVEVPCYIGENVSFEKGAHIGPFCVIGSGSSIGRNSKIEGCILQSVKIGADCEICGSILCSGAAVGNNCLIGSGCVIGDGTSIGSGSVIDGELKIWPNKNIPEGSHVCSSITDNGRQYTPFFDSDAKIHCEAIAELDADGMIKLGLGAGKLGASAAAFSGGNYARIAAESYLEGVASSGCEAYLLDSQFAANAAFSARSYDFPTTVFIRQQGKFLDINFYDSKGLPIERSMQRKIESAFSGDIFRADTEDIGGKSSISGCELLHSAAAAKMHARNSSNSAAAFAVSGRNASARVLISALSASGFSVVPASDGIVEFRVSKDGFELSAVTESGFTLSHEKLLIIWTYCELDAGAESIALPYHAPMAADAEARMLGGRILRLERDGDEALKRYAALPCSSDGIFLAVRLAHFISENSVLLDSLYKKVPEFHIVQTESDCKCDRQRLLHLLGVSQKDSELVSGIKYRDTKGTVSVRPINASKIRITAESFSEEYADELCGKVEEKLNADVAPNKK